MATQWEKKPDDTGKQGDVGKQGGEIGKQGGKPDMPKEGEKTPPKTGDQPR